MPHSELAKSKSMHKTLRTSLPKITNKLTDQLTRDTISNDEIEHLKFQLIEKAEQIFKLDSEIQKIIETLEKAVASSQR